MKATGLLCPEMCISSSAGKPDRYIFVQNDRRQVCDEIISPNRTEIEVTFIAHEKGKECIKIYEKALSEKETVSENWKKQNELFGSASGFKFKEMARGYTLDALLTYHLAHRNGRDGTSPNARTQNRRHFACSGNDGTHHRTSSCD